MIEKLLFWKSRYYDKSPEVITAYYFKRSYFKKKLTKFVDSKKEVFTIDLTDTCRITDYGMKIIKSLDKVFCNLADNDEKMKAVKFINIPIYLKEKLQKSRLEKYITIKSNKYGNL